VDGEEVGGEAQLADQLQLMGNLVTDLLRESIGIALLGAGPGEADQLFLRRAPVGHRIDRVFVAQLVEAEAAGLGDLDGAGDGIRAVAEQPRHLGGRLQVALGVGVQQEAGVVDGAVLADAGEHVLQWPALGRMGVHVVGGDQRNAARGGKIAQVRKSTGIVTTIKIIHREIKIFIEVISQFRKGLGEGRVGYRGRHGDDDLAVAVGADVAEHEVAFTLRRAAAADGQQRRQSPVGGAVGGQHNELRPVGGGEAGADDEADAGLLRRHMGADHAGQGVTIGDRHRLEAEDGGGSDQLLGHRRPAQERERAGHLQFGIGGHDRRSYLMGCRRGKFAEMTDKPRDAGNSNCGNELFVGGDEKTVRGFGTGEIEAIVYGMP